MGSTTNCQGPWVHDTMGEKFKVFVTLQKGQENVMVKTTHLVHNFIIPANCGNHDQAVQWVMGSTKKCFRMDGRYYQGTIYLLLMVLTCIYLWAGKGHTDFTNSHGSWPILTPLKVERKTTLYKGLNYAVYLKSYTVKPMNRGHYMPGVISSQVHLNIKTQIGEHQMQFRYHEYHRFYCGRIIASPIPIYFTILQRYF